MILPLQKNLFLPGKTSHFLRAAVFFLWGDSMGEELWVLIWLYSQSFMGPPLPGGIHEGSRRGARGPRSPPAARAPPSHGRPSSPGAAAPKRDPSSATTLRRTPR